MTARDIKTIVTDHVAPGAAIGASYMDMVRNGTDIIHLIIALLVFVWTIWRFIIWYNKREDENSD
jgi:heme A synthase